MPLVNTSIEIAATPAMVRDKFLDFSSMPKYTPNGFIRSIAPVTPEQSPSSLKAGDKLNCSIGYGKMQISPIVHTNSPSMFSWIGSVPGIYTGVQKFRFEEVPGSAEGEQSRTKFTHEEQFSGLLSFIMSENFVARSIGVTESTKKGFEGFNGDFKAWVEQGDSRN